MISRLVRRWIASGPTSPRRAAPVLTRALPFVILSLTAASSASAQTYTLIPGATVWDDTTANWQAPGGQVVPYPNASSVNPVINGPASVTLTLPRVCGDLTLTGGVTLGAVSNAYLLVLQGRSIVAFGGTNTISSRILPFPDTGVLTLTGGGTQIYTRSIEFGGIDVTVAQGQTRLGAAASLTARTLRVGSTATPFTNLMAAAGAVFETGDFIVGPTPDNAVGNGVVTTTETTFNIGGNLTVGNGCQGYFTADGGAVNVGGVVTLAASALPNQSLPTVGVTMRNTTLTVADTGGLPGIRGPFIGRGAGDIGYVPSFQLPGTRIRVRTGGFLTVDALMGLGVNNTIADTTGGDARFDGRLWGKTLIKEGPGVLKLTRDNRNGGGGGGVVDGTIVRGGFIEFSDSLNLNDGGYSNYAADQSATPTGLVNIQLNGGGLRWAAGSTVDISSRLRLLNNFSFDTNGNNVAFGTALAGTGGMTKFGAGILTPAATNSYAGGTTVKGGSVQFTSLATFGSGNLTLDGGGLRWAAGSTTDVSARLNALGAGGGSFDTNGNNVTLGTPVSGPGNLTKLGAGTLTLNGTHPWTGNAIVSAGTLALNGTFAGKNALFVGGPGAGGTLTLTGTLGISTTAQIAFSAGDVGTVNVGGSSSLSAGSYLEVGSGGSGALNVTNGGQVTAATSIALGVQPNSLGTANLSGFGAGGSVPASMSAGTTLFVGYASTGLLTIGNGGLVTVGGQLVLGSQFGGSGTVVVNSGGTLTLGGTNGILGGAGVYLLGLAGGTLKVQTANLTTSVPLSLTNQSTVDTGSFSAVFEGALSGAGGITKKGSGILYLNAGSSFTGGTQVAGGQIVVPSEASLGSGPLAVQSGSLYSTATLSLDATISVDGGASSLAAASFIEVGKNGPGSLAVTNGGQVGTSSSIALGVAGGSVGQADLSGVGSQMSCGTTLFLGFLGSGRMTVGAGATVSAGQVSLAAAGGSQGTFILAPGGQLNVGGPDGIVRGAGTASFQLSGGLLKVTGSSLTTAVPMAVTNAGPLIDTSGVNCTLGGTLSGDGTLSKTGAGTLTLAAANALTGPTVLYAGTLSANTPASLGTGALALSGGTLNLTYSGTATVQSLTFDGVVQAAGLWGSLTSTATNKTSRITGNGLLNVLTSTVPPAFNPQATAGLSYPIGQGLVNLASATGATPAGGTFSGPGVTNGSFDPAAVGYGIFTLTYTAAGGSATFTIAVTGGLTLDEEGGSVVPGNLAPGGTAFARNVLPAPPNHTIPHLNDANYGNSFSWIGTGANSYAGVRFASAVAVSRLAFGRDNTGGFTDRCADYYTVQYSTDPDPSAPTATWTTLGALDYRPGGSAGITLPARRHLFSFPAVTATGLRIVTATDGTAIDEIEIYPATGLFASTGLTLVQESGGLAPNNLALAPAGTAFSKDEIGVAPHATGNVNNGTYGNASSWIGGSANSFVGVNLGGSFLLDRIAFGRDNSGSLTDRTLGRYTLQYTTVANPGAGTPEASWTTIGFLDYQSAGGTKFATPSLRHLYGFPAVTATGVRLVAPTNAAIDELEIYRAAPHVKLESPVGTPVGATVDFGTRFLDAPTTRIFTVTNDGTSTLTLTNLSLTGATAGDFTITSLSATTLEPGASATFSVTFTVGAPGAHSASVTLASNDPAPPYTFAVTGLSLVPTVNAAAINGLSYDIGAAAVDLATVTQAGPPGGTFSGPGVTANVFTPAAAGYGRQTVTYSYGGASTTFFVYVTGGLALVTEGATFAPRNLAPAGVAFAKDVFPGYSAHTIPHLNDGIYGNSNSWISNSADSFAGLSLGSTPVPVTRLAFGRDNQGQFTDRCTDYYLIQYTTEPNPDATTTNWTSLGALDYRNGNPAQLALRHLYSFPTVQATGFRIVTATAGTGIDEIELYAPLTPLETWRLQYFGTPDNVGLAANEADPVGDGLKNLQRYAFGLNPLVNNGPRALPALQYGPGTLSYSFSGVAGVTYGAESSTDLINWTPIPDTGVGNGHVFTLPRTGAKTFTRLRVTAQ